MQRNSSCQYGYHAAPGALAHHVSVERVEDTLVRKLHRVEVRDPLGGLFLRELVRYVEKNAQTNGFGEDSLTKRHKMDRMYPVRIS